MKCAPSRGFEATAGNAFSGAGTAADTGAEMGAAKSSSSTSPIRSTTFAGAFAAGGAGAEAVVDADVRDAEAPLVRVVVEFERRGALRSSSPALYSSNPR